MTEEFDQDIVETVSDLMRRARNEPPARMIALKGAYPPGTTLAEARRLTEERDKALPRLDRRLDDGGENV